MASSMRRVVGLSVSVLAVAAALAATPAAGQGARLLADVNQRFDTVPGSQPRQMVSLGDTVVFVADAPYRSIWRSDGTSAGTYPLLEGDPWHPLEPSLLGQLGSIAFFLPGGDGESVAPGLWRTDGTAIGSFSIEIPGRRVGLVEGADWHRRAASYQGRLHFVVQVSEEQRAELWRTDGTLSGTEIVTEIPGEHGAAELAVVGDRLLVFFGSEVWRSDGTAAGTIRADELRGWTGSSLVATSDSHAFIEVRDSSLLLYDLDLFAIPAEGGGYERVLPEDQDLWPWGMVYTVGREAFFVAMRRRGGSGSVIWRTDGTLAGSRAVSGSHPEPRNTWRAERGDDPTIALLPRGVFYLADVSADEVALQLTNRDPEDARTVLSLGRREGLADEHFWVVSLGERLLFPRLAEAGLELWVSDGTAAGSRMLADACPGPCDSRPVHPLVVGSRLFWVAADEQGGQSLWTTDGTAFGTVPLLHGMQELGPRTDREIWSFAKAGPNWLFAGTDPYRGQELWIAGSARDSGKIVRDLVFEVPGSSLVSTVADGEESFLGVAIDRAREWRLLKTDGVSPPRDLLTVEISSEAPALIPVAGGLVVALPPWRGGVLALDRETDETTELFAPTSPDEARDLRIVGSVDRSAALFRDVYSDDFFLTDGTEEGSARISSAACPSGFDPIGTAGGRYVLLGRRSGVCSFDTATRTPLPLPGPPFGWELCEGGLAYFCDPVFVDSRGRLYYEFWSNSQHRVSLWRSDGTPAGTKEVVSPDAGTLIGAVAVGSDLVYAIRPGNTRVSLSVLRDGEAGPVELWLSELNTPSGVAETLLETDRGVLFVGWDPEHGGEVWLADPLSTSVMPLTEFTGSAVPSLGSSVPGRHLTYFERVDPEGPRLWRTDTTVGGTFSVGPITESLERDSAISGDRLFFRHDDGAHGVELWTSDGSTGGTRMVADIRPGADGSNPEDLAVGGSYLYFTADDGVHGREVWVTPIEGGEPCRASETALCLGGGRFRVGMDRIAPDGHLESAKTIPLGEERGLFWFFSPDLYEVLVALEPSPSGPDHTQVRIGSTSNVWFALTVDDRTSAASRRYLNPAGNYTSFVDAAAFGPPGSLVPRRVDIPLPAGREGEALAKANGGGASGTCTPSATRLCLLDGRYAVEARWRDAEGGQVPSAVARFTNESGLLGAIGADDPTWIVKLLDARALTGHLWFFVGGIADDELEITVVETATGRSRTYLHASGELPAAADYELF